MAKLSDEKIRAIAAQIAKEQAEIKATAEPNKDEVRKHVEAAQKATEDARNEPTGLTAEDVKLAVRDQLADMIREVGIADGDKARDATMVQAELRAVLDSDGDAQIRELQNAHADLVLGRTILQAKNRRSGMPVKTPTLDARFDRALKGCGFESRDLTSGTSGSGAEWVFAQPERELVPRVSAVGNLEAAFQNVTIPANVGSLTLPTHGSRATGYLIGEGVSVTESTPGTSSVTLDPVKIAGRVDVSMEAVEDAIVAMLPYVQNELAETLARATEEAIISGDTAGTHQDSDTTGATDRRKAFIGLRAKAVDASGTKDMSSLTTAADTAVLRQVMGAYGVDPSQLMLILPFEQYFAWLKDTDLKTENLVGAAATLVTGMLGAIGGMPVLVSELFRQDLNASGVYDGTTTTKHGYLIVRRDGWVVGAKRAISVKTFADITTDTLQVVGTKRVDVEPKHGSDRATADANNIANAERVGT